MPSPKIEIGAEIKNARGELIRKVPFRRCHSLLKSFIAILYTQFTNQDVNIKDITGTIRTQHSNAYNFRMVCTTDTNLNVLVGNGTTAITMEDYQLAAQITSDITHQSPSFAMENPNSTTWRIAISRGFYNNTEVNIEVEEVGLVSLFGASQYLTLIDRTLYNVTIGAGETLTLTYRISITL